MSGLKIYLIRHGKTVWNVENRLQGQLDSPLADSSPAALCALDQELAGIPFRHCFRSPMGRVESSIACMPSLFTKQWTTIGELREISCGTYAGLRMNELDSAFLEARKLDPWSTSWPAGESYRDVWDRTSDFAAHVLSLQGPVVIFAHETVNRVLLGHFANLPPQGITSLRQPNTTVFRVEDQQIDFLNASADWIKGAVISKQTKFYENHSNGPS